MTTTPNHAPNRLTVLGALIAIQILFGVNYAVSKVVISNFPPLLWASLRIIIASGLMILIALLLRRKHPSGGKKFFVPLIVFALLGMIINQSAFIVGLKYTTATNSAILNTLIPIFTLLIVTIRGQEPLTTKKAIGFGLALCGVLTLRRIEDFSFSNATFIGDLLNVLNCLSYAMFLSFGKKFIEKHDRIWTTTWLFVYGSVGLTILAVPDWLTFSWPVITNSLWAAMAFVIFGATLLTYFLNLWTLAHANSSHVALFTYLQPIVAALTAWMVMSEPITTRSAFSTLLIFAGMLLGVASPRSKSRLSKTNKIL